MHFGYFKMAVSAVEVHLESHYQHSVGSLSVETDSIEVISTLNLSIFNNTLPTPHPLHSPHTQQHSFANEVVTPIIIPIIINIPITL